MFSLQETFSATIEEKKSKFIAYLAPYKEFDKLFKSLQKEHPKARHLVSAFRYLNEFDQIVEGSSDDGEPRGTAGKPALHVLQGNELINVCVIVVRYFGGTKLGTGGLVRAYSDSVNHVLKDAKLVKYEKEESFSFKCTYNNLGKIEHTLEQLGITKIQKDFQALHVELEIKSTPEILERLKTQLINQNLSTTDIL